jgi:hypothetical protein
MSREQAQIEAVERLLQRQRDMSGFGYDDGFITVSIGEVEGALTEGAAEWDAEQEGVHEIEKWVGLYASGEKTVRQLLTEAGFEDQHVAAFIAHNAVCPECVAGKHENCDGTALSEDDEVVGCRCERNGHNE